MVIWVLLPSQDFCGGDLVGLMVYEGSLWHLQFGNAPVSLLQWAVSTFCKPSCTSSNSKS